MSSSSPPIIAFELGVGEFRIVTPEAVYQIKVSPELVKAARPGGSEERPGAAPASFLKACRDLVEAVQSEPVRGGEEPASAPAAATDDPKDSSGSFFKEISEELFDKIGRLARRLSVSVEELPDQVQVPDLDLTDRQLENAKGQLEEIVQITEKASMTIMDTADQIQVEMDQLQDQLNVLQKLDLMAEPAAPETVPATTQVGILDRPSMPPSFFEKLGELQSFVSRLLDGEAEADTGPEPEPALESEPEPVPEPTPGPAEPRTTTVVRFDVGVVFQTLYELCTNESVKDHIKRMRDAKDADFRTEEVAQKLSEMAPTVDAEDGFYNFPITAVLKTLYSATVVEDFRLTLKKMNQTAASIFLDSVLPIEGETVEVAASEAAPPPPPEPEPEPEPTPEPGPAPAPIPTGGPVCSRENLETIQTLTAELGRLSEGLRTLPADGPAAAAVVEATASGGLYTSILTQDRDTIVRTVSMAHQLIHQTGGHLTRILEALSFQDLSGQRIMKVVALIGDIQMQLLSILVSVNAKIKVHEATGEMAAKSEQTERMAQEEVDKALEMVAAGGSTLMGPGAEGRLDQGAVNDLLAQLGF